MSQIYLQEDLIDIFIEFKNKLKKKYESLPEMEYRFKIFRQNYTKMNENEVKKKGFFGYLFGKEDKDEIIENKSYKTEMNKFADMTDKEFDKYYIMDDDIFDEKTEA